MAVARLSLDPRIKRLILHYFEYQNTRPIPIAGENIYTIAHNFSYFTIPEIKLAFKLFIELEKYFGLR
jgi:hypothetical protein